MKKFLAVILSVLMILSVSSMASGLELEADYVIEAYETITVTASVSNNPVIKFVPEESVSLIVASFAEEVDPYCDIESGDGLISMSIDDSSGYVYNFREFFDFEAGIEYYITIRTYSEEDASFDVALLCNHDFVDETCVLCEAVCDHDAEGTKFSTCACGKVSDCKKITLGETVNDTFNGNEPIYVCFTPDEDVTAIFYSETDLDVKGTIFDKRGNYIIEDDDFASSYNFCIIYEFEAGETYFLEVLTYYESADIKFTLDYAVHTADDGEKHDLTYIEESWGNCSELAFSEALYCAECDEYIAGHDDNGYGFCCDDDWDDYCDYCGEYTYEEDPDVNHDDDTDTDADEEAENALLTKVYNIFMIFVEFFLETLSVLLSKI